MRMLKPQFSHQDVKILTKETLFKRFFQINLYTLQHKLFSGGWSDSIQLELFERGDAVVVLPYDPVLRKVVLVEQFRIGALSSESPWLLELVAGMIESGEAPEEVAHREGAEEAGCEFKALQFLHRYLVSAGGTSERIWMFCGHVDSTQVQSFGGLDAENEDIKVHVIDVDEVFALLDAGRLDNAAAIIAVQWLKMHETSLREQWL